MDSTILHNFIPKKLQPSWSLNMRLSLSGDAAIHPQHISKLLDQFLNIWSILKNKVITKLNCHPKLYPFRI